MCDCAEPVKGRARSRELALPAVLCEPFVRNSRMTVTLIVHRRAGIGQLVRTPVLRGLENTIASRDETRGCPRH